MRLLSPLLVLVVLLAGALAAGAPAEVRQEGNLRVKFNGSFAPHALPRNRLAPVRVKIEGKISTTDGSHPPPLRALELALNSHGRLSTRGLPTCQAATLQSTSTQEALARCGGALVGRGRFHTAFAFGAGSPIPSDGEVLAFNSGRPSRPAVLLHLFGTVPVRATFVVPLRIGHQAGGNFGTVLRARIPRLAGGVGSITGISLTIGRTYSFRGRRRSYLSASCDAPAGFSAAVFPFLRGGFTFAEHQEIRTTLIRACQVH